MSRVLATIFLVQLAVIPAGGRAQETDLPPRVRQLVNAALERTRHEVVYDGSYRALGYPGGDVPDNVGVCTDVIIRSYRALGVDLQELVHEDMTAAFGEYPRIWGLDHPDPNIDHRRVPNLQKFFARQDAELRVTSDPVDYRPGDVVTWLIPGNLPHIGIVVDRWSRDGDRPLVVHNIGTGPVLEDALFSFEITGHYRYLPSSLAAQEGVSIPKFLDELFNEVQTEYASFREPEFSEFVSANGLDPTDTTNRRTFFRVTFLHDLLTTSSASNCARGGFLRIPYFWHWVEPNPRHDILALPDSVPLTSIKPQSPYQRYASFADIDRVPALYLGDLVTETPGYFHPDCGSFFTFGWCSEREMAYTALMTSWGHPSKIWQSGIHTFSVVWCEFKTTTGTTKVMAAEVDNTFDFISWVEVPDTVTLERWLGETGNGAQIDWYNDKARSPEQIEALRAKAVSQGAITRIRNLIHEAMSRS